MTLRNCRGRSPWSIRNAVLRSIAIEEHTDLHWSLKPGAGPNNVVQSMALIRDGIVIVEKYATSVSSRNIGWCSVGFGLE